jgi:hypothetical protein
MSSLISKENKELLWGILAEEGIFDGIPANVTPQEVKHVFEQILKNLSANIPAIHAGRLKELYRAKQQAIADEDYDVAKKIRTTIGEMEAVLPRLEKLEQRKQQAIHAEDFEAAKQLKSEIDRVRSTAFSLRDINKIALQSLVIHIPKVAREISERKSGLFIGGNNGGGGGFETNVREIYNAEDFHSRKREEIETKLREKEAEMRSYFEVPRPKEIDFSDVPRDSHTKIKSAKKNQTENDNDDNNDSPLADNSDDMEKIIAERLAARQRDLNKISERFKETMPPEYRQSLEKTPEYNPNDINNHSNHAQQIPMPLLSPIPASARSTSSEDPRRVRFQDEV